MATRATFTGFEPYKLSGVRVTDRELGHGSYAIVLELEYMGLKINVLVKSFMMCY